MNTKIITALVIGIALVGLIGTGLVSGQNIVEPPTVEKTVLPTEVYVAGTDCAGLNEEATITITVTGAGGEHGVVPPLDVVFAIDSSGSMGWNDPTDLRLTASKAFVDMMDPAEDQAGVVSWDGGIDFTHLLDSDFVAVNNAIDNVDSSGGTNLNVGLYEAISVLDANTRIEDSTEVIIFLTDGAGGYTYAADGGPAFDAAAKGYVIFPIGLGSGHVAGPLMDMADATGGTYYSAPSAENLQAIFDAIHEEIITSTIPHYVNVYEVTEGEIDVVGPCNPVPDDISTNPVTGYTTIIWYDIGNGNLTADETVVLTCVIKSTEVGEDMPVQVEGMALVEYADSKGNVVGVVDIPQAYLTQIDLWIGTNKELDELIEKVDAATMPNIIKRRLIGKLEYAKALKDNAKIECEDENFDYATKKLGVAKNQMESFERMVKRTRRISPADKASFLAESAKIIEKIDELIEYIETEHRC